MSQRDADRSFFRKVVKFSKVAGFDVIENALVLYYTMQRPECPLWAKTVIVSALAYYISPLDAIPDFVPAIGYSDDLATLAGAVVSVALHTDGPVKTQAKEKMSAVFGESYEDAGGAGKESS